MANEERGPAGVLRSASRYMGIFAGAVAALGKGIAHACENGVKAVGGLFIPCKRKSEEYPAEESSTEPSEVTEPKDTKEPERVSAEERRDLLKTESIPESEADAEAEAPEPSDTRAGKKEPSTSENDSSTTGE